MKIILWPGGHDFLSSAITLLTHGKGSHAAFLRSDGHTIVEAFWPQVRERQFKDGERETVEIYELEGLDADDHQHFEAWFDAVLKDPPKYSIIDLFRYALNHPNMDDGHTFCSRLVMHGCEHVLAEHLWPLVRLPCGDWASPRDLRISPRLHIDSSSRVKLMRR